MVRTQRFHCRELGFDLGTKILQAMQSNQKGKKKKKIVKLNPVYLEY